MSKQIIEKILALKKNRKAVILAHNYQLPEVQDIADFTGDSLGLSIEASKTKAEVIVFCGVKFMAETAVILCPEKTVLLPDINAGCPMADMISAAELRELKKKHPNAAVVCYVNSTAEVKAESDYCCTSSNAVEVVNSLPEDKEIIFVPDQHLGRYVAEQTERNFILWPGYCITHIVISEDDIRKARQKYPDAMVLVHPECSEPVKALADRIFSTGQMLKFAGKSGVKRFIIGTETGIIHALKKVNPEAEYIAASEKAVCPNMKRINLEKVLWSLEDNKYKITVPEEIRVRAKNALDRMIQIQV
jgi:quinolinate synthase